MHSKNTSIICFILLILLVISHSTEGASNQMSALHSYEFTPLSNTYRYSGNILGSGESDGKVTQTVDIELTYRKRPRIAEIVYNLKYMSDGSKYSGNYQAIVADDPLLYQNLGCTLKSKSGNIPGIGGFDIFHDPCSAARAFMSSQTLASLKSEYEAIATAAVDQPPIPVSPKENSTVSNPFKVEFEAVMPFHVVTPCQSWQFEVETMFISSDVTVVFSQSPYAVYTFGAYGGEAENNFLCRGKSTLIANLKSGRNKFRIRAKNSDGRETPWSLWFGFDVPEKTVDKDAVGDQPLQQAPAPPGLDPDKARAIMPEGDGQSLPIDADAALGKDPAIRPPEGSGKLAKENDGSSGIPGFGREKIVAGSAVDGQNGLKIDPAQHSSLLAKTQVRIKEPKQNQFYDTFHQGNVPFQLWLELPHASELVIRIKKDSEILFTETIAKGGLAYRSDRQAPPGVYTVEARMMEESTSPASSKPGQIQSAVDTPWSGPVTFYLGVAPPIAVSTDRKALAKQESTEMTQYSSQGPLLPEGAVLPDSGAAVRTSTGGKIPKIVRPTNNQVLVSKEGEEKCVDIEVAHLPSVFAYKANPINRMITWNVYVDWQYSPTPESLFSSLETVNQTPSESNFVKNYCLASGRYKIRAWAKERELKQEGDGWVEEFTHHYGQWQQFSIAPLQVDRDPAVDSSKLSSIGLSKQQRPVTVKSKQSSPLATPMIKKGMEPPDHPAPQLMSLSRNQNIKANSLTTLLVKHLANQKPLFEFEYYDGKRWQKARSIRPIIIPTPATGGTGQVITQAKFRIAQAGKYRCRVKSDEDDGKFSPYQEFTVVGQLPRGLSGQLDHSVPVNRGASAAELKIGKASKSPQKSSANELKGSDSIEVKPKKQLQPTKSLRITSPIQNQSFWAPANVAIKTSHDSRFQLKYALSKNNGAFIHQPNGNLTNLTAGKYKIRVRYNTAVVLWQEIPFVVKPPIKKQAVRTQPQTQITPQQKRMSTE